MAEPTKTDRWPECAAQLDPRLAGFFLDASTPHTATYRKRENVRYDLVFEAERATDQPIPITKESRAAASGRLSFWRRFLNTILWRT